MANTVVKNGKMIEFTAVDTDINLAALYPEFDTAGRGEVRIKAIGFTGNAADVLIVRNGGIDGAAICQLTLTAEERDKMVHFGEKGLLCKPYIDVSDCTVAGTERIIFIMA